MFISIIASSLVFGLAGACWRYIVSKQAVKHEPEVQKTVSIDDCTKVHKNALDTVMEILDTTNDDATVNFISVVVNNAIVEKQESDGKRISIRRLVEKSVIAVLQVRKYAKWKQYVEDHNTIPFLSSVIARNFVSDNPLEEVEIDDIDSKLLEKGGIFENMLHSYSSKGLTATDLQSMVMARKRRKVNVQAKVEQFLETKRGNTEPISRKDIKRHFGESEFNSAWTYIRANLKSLESKHGVKILKRATPVKLDPTNENFRSECFYMASSPKLGGTKYFYATAKIKYNGKTLVQKGSIARFEITPTFDPVDPDTKEVDTTNSDIRNQLISSGILELHESGNYYVFTQDYEFTAGSRAGNIVSGARKGGPDCWLVEGTKKSLKQLMEDETP
jgi:hypothetical protein